jgi:stigma-specific protein Stig1
MRKSIAWIAGLSLCSACSTLSGFEPFQESVPYDDAGEAGVRISLVEASVVETGVGVEAAAVPVSDAFVDAPVADVLVFTDAEAGGSVVDVVMVGQDVVEADAPSQVVTVVPCVGSCATGATCVNGECVCQDEPDLCSTTCVDLMTDPGHCGGCSLVCPTGAMCLTGGCVCPASQPTACGPACVDTQTDHANCGGCGTACAAGESCHAGVCAPCGSAYATDETCSGVCVDPTSDDKNCGGCGTACPSGAPCKNRVCTCPSGDTVCAFECVNTSTDHNNCGGCGNVCTLANAHSTCDKTCILSSCYPGYNNCDKIDSNGCESNPLTDVNNCGACSTATVSHACTDGKTCSDGACVCPSGAHSCSGTCVSNTSTSTASCGTSCEACAAPVNGEATCMGASPICGEFCNKAGYATLCGSACVNITTDPSNCGGCGMTCAVEEMCTAGACMFPIEAGVDAGGDAMIDSGVVDDARPDVLISEGGSTND